MSPSTPFHPKQEPKGNGMCDEIVKAVDRFDNAAQSWGWFADQGCGDQDQQDSCDEHALARTALLDAIQAERNKDRWNSDMDAAPKDGTNIMVWAVGYLWPEIVRYELYGDAELEEETGQTGYWRYSDDLLADVASADEEIFSCWQFLPAPPAAITEGSK